MPDYTLNQSKTIDVQLRQSETKNVTLNQSKTIDAQLPAALATGGTTATVTITPATFTIDVGSTTELTADAFDSGGTAIGYSDTDFTWTSSDTGIATVDADGTVTGVADGSVTITATVDGVSDTSSGTVNAVSPYADIVATSPTLFVPLKYASTDADGQILYKDSAATTAVTSAGDPVGAVKWDGSIVAEQPTDAQRPTWGGDTVGVQFDKPSTQHLQVPNKSQSNFLHLGAAAAAWRVTWDDQSANSAAGIFVNNNYSRRGTGATVFYDDRDSQPRTNAVALIVGPGDGTTNTFSYDGSFGSGDVPSGDHIGGVSYDMSNPAQLYIDGTEDADTIAYNGDLATGDSTDLLFIGGDPSFAILMFDGKMQALVFYNSDKTASEQTTIYNALNGI